MATNGIKISSQSQILDANVDKDVTFTTIRDTGGGAYVNEKMTLEQISDFSSITDNDIINGNLDVWERNTTFNPITDGTYFADRFVYIKNGAGVHRINRSTTVPNNNYNYSARLAITIGDGAIAATDYYAIETRLEGYNIIKYVDGYLTFGFWMRSGTTGTYCATIRNGARDRSYVTEFTINALDTYEFKTITVPIDFTGTIDTINGTGLILTIVLAAGSNYHTTAGAWQTGNFLSTANQVNSVDSTLKEIYFAGFSANKGSIVNPNFSYDISMEKLKCARYYQRITPATTQPIGSMIATSTSTLKMTFITQVEMRDDPTLVTTENIFINATAGAAVAATLSSISATTKDSNRVVAQWNDTGTPFLTNNYYVFSMNAAYIEFDAELS